MHSQSLSFKPVTTPCLCSCAKQLRVSPIEITRITSIHYSYCEYPQSEFIHYSYCEYPQSTLLVLRVSNPPPPPLRVVRCQDYCVVVGRECECLLMRLCACLVFQTKTSATSIVGLLCGVIEIHTHIKLCAHAHTTTLNPTSELTHTLALTPTPNPNTKRNP